MRLGAAASAFVAFGLLVGGSARAGEAADAGSDAAPAIDSDASAADGGPGAPAAPAPLPERRPAAPPPVPTPATAAQVPAIRPDAAAERTRRNRELWSLAYVDRPQTMYAGMEALSLFGLDYFGGPTGYRRFRSGLGYEKAITDRLQLDISFPWLYCSGAGAGACSSSLDVVLAGWAAVLMGPRARLELGASFADLTYSASAWARLKLVAPHRFSFEIEPSALFGLAQNPVSAWWDPNVTQDGNQSRVFLTLDANLQLSERLVVWADAIPYLRLADLGAPSGAAVQAVAGIGASVTKAWEAGASCFTMNVLTARRWEYEPNVRGCTLSVTARGFGPGPSGYVTVPVPQPLY